jgi:hypothetical protein
VDGMTTPPPSPDAETPDLPSRFDAAAERAKAAIRAAQAECAKWYAPAELATERMAGMEE